MISIFGTRFAIFPYVLVEPVSTKTEIEYLEK